MHRADPNADLHSADPNTSSAASTVASASKRSKADAKEAELRLLSVRRGIGDHEREKEHGQLCTQDAVAAAAAALPQIQTPP